MTPNRQRAVALRVLLLLLLAALPLAGAAREILITPNPANQEAPAIRGDRIVWEDNRHGHWDIYLYTISTGSEERLTTDTASPKGPRIWDDRVVREDWRNGNAVVYLYPLAAPSTPP